MQLISHRLNNLKKEYDVIIIGGGIYGATLLYEATLRGLSAILVEKGDFCNATSANSLKIIHGGLRYLQSLDLKRIRESVDEQYNLIKIAPHLIQPLSCVIPTYPQIKNSKLAMGLAFKLYELIRFSHRNNTNAKLPPGKILSKNELHSLVPVLNLRGATGGALWYDALNYNSEKLTLNFIRSACERDADAFNYLEFQDFIIRKDSIKGIQAYDKLSRQRLEILGHFVVNAAGPWINTICGQIGLNLKENQFQFAKAVNFIIPRSLSDYAFGLRASNFVVDDYSQSNRFLFFVPWRGSTMIGTWYFAYNGSPEEVSLTENEYLKCIGQIQHLLPDAHIQKDEVCFVHLGLVPTESGKGNNKFELKNHYSLVDHHENGGPSGLISVLGVKYTTARNVAVKTADLILKKLSYLPNKHDIEIRPLSGGDIKEIDEFIQEKSMGNYHKLTDETVCHLARNYGINFNDIENLIADNAELAELIPGSAEAIKAELPYCLKNEFVYHLSDFILRRTGVGSVKKPEDETINYCVDFMAKEMGWGETQKKDEVNSLLNFYNRFPGDK